MENDRRPLISVVMPNYNGAAFFDKAIESVLKQTYTNFELIIVDDSSADDSVLVLEKMAETDARIRLIPLAKNGGVANARNAGIREAKGRYIALIDNDDTWEPDKLERQLRLAENGAQIVYTSYDLVDENGARLREPFLIPEKTSFKEMLSCNVIGCSTVFIDAQLLKEHPFRSDIYHEDYALWMELLRIPVNAAGDPKVLMHYRKMPGSRSDNKVNAAKMRWDIYRQVLGLGFFTSARAFLGYAVNGVRKHGL